MEVAVVEVQIKEWGNSQGIRFPKSVLQEAGFSVNENLTVEVKRERSSCPILSNIKHWKSVSVNPDVS